MADPFERAKEVLRFYRAFSTTIPDEVNTLGILHTTLAGLCVVAITVCYNGAIEEGEKVLQPLRAFGSPLADQLSPLPYTVLQAMTDNLFPRWRRYYWKGRA